MGAEMQMLADMRARLRAFFKSTGGNIAVTVALSAIPLTLAMGAGIDYARGLAVHSNMSDALDSAALAVGSATTKPSSCTSGSSSTACASLQAIAQQYFNANFKPDSSADTVGQVSLSIVNQSVTLSVTDTVPTTFLKSADKLLNSTALDSMAVSASSTVVWGQTKLWVALVLDNTGSMTQTDSTGTSKISALKTAANNLITTLQGASSTVGDVQMSLTTFAKLVNMGTSYVNSSNIDWTHYSAEPVDLTGTYDPPVPGTSGSLTGYVGPGDSCPWSTSTRSGSDGFGCYNAPATSWDTTNWSPANSSLGSGSRADLSTTSTIPSSGTYSGYICPGVVSGYTDIETYNANSVTGGHYFNGCYTTKTTGSYKTISTGSFATCNGSGYANCACSGNGSGKICKTPQYSYTWVANAHSAWDGCVEDRPQDSDTNNTAPGGTSTNFPAANDDNCPITSVLPLPSTWTAAQWTTLSTEIGNMTAQGSTNQTIGLAHGWQTLTNAGPYNAPALPSNTSQYIILISDGLNTEDRWFGDGSDESASVNTREALACTNAKTAGITIYTIYVDLGGTQGNSAPLQSCATDSTKYFDLQTSGAIITTLNNIGQQITNLRVSK
jgi:Flp pilus assembly protein TadG